MEGLGNTTLTQNVFDDEQVNLLWSEILSDDVRGMIRAVKMVKNGDVISGMLSLQMDKFTGEFSVLNVDCFCLTLASKKIQATSTNGYPPDLEHMRPNARSDLEISFPDAYYPLTDKNKNKRGVPVTSFVLQRTSGSIRTSKVSSFGLRRAVGRWV
ncbi:hypothetical protein OIU79_023038 [Salix purpurea]|uniref:Uncharacterized protein n=1 Tax=Salix purpurea TaxID=77065 RepID=A0A9Q0WI52_SALPP|nr:hypothetical protein OIU79_023038 [Salix purpurea]